MRWGLCPQATVPYTQHAHPADPRSNMLQTGPHAPDGSSTRAKHGMTVQRGCITVLQTKAALAVQIMKADGKIKHKTHNHMQEITGRPNCVLRLQERGARGKISSTGTSQLQTVTPVL